ncbi:hypothetical protein GCM10010121_075530 [Streptomyces brasiliensis]|uniref:Uncharacterized protein n=1 Tax=Streptomyces brasiliensis TaxID=1954 RepID=A0A917LCP0_9ACTN|nr:hypothetical protein GCM10010121_075530 [Streptomyces brasiliensis]
MRTPGTVRTRGTSSFHIGPHADDLGKRGGETAGSFPAPDDWRMSENRRTVGGTVPHGRLADTACHR